ncbi:MAG: N-acetyltransferase [Pseudomonadota bacterium]
MMIINKTQFRASTAADLAGIKSLHARAFGRETEGALAGALLNDQLTFTLDLVAELDTMIIGHVLLCEVQEGPDKALVLGPLAVDPAWRDFQIGTALARRVLADARLGGWKSVFVLGEPDYYRRFGFKRALTENVRCAYNIGLNFMGVELQTGSLDGFVGVVRCPQAFHDVE